MNRPYDRTRTFTPRLLFLGFLMFFAAAISALTVGATAAGVLGITGRELSWVGGQVVLGIGWFLGAGLYIALVLRPAGRARRKLLEEEWLAAHPTGDLG